MGIDLFSYILGKNAGGGGGSTINNQDIIVTQNGEYTAESGYTGLGTVTVNVPAPNIWSDCGYNTTPQTINDAHTLTKACYDGWDSSWTSFDGYMDNYSDLIIVPMIDTSNITSFSRSFRNCSQIVDFPLLNTSNATGFSNVFYNCTSLKNVPVLDTSKADNLSGFFSNCPKLSTTSLNNILQMCINATSYNATKTLYYLGLRSGNYPVETIEALPKYQDFITAGWTIGY